MKLLDKLVLKELVPMFFIGVCLFTGLAFAGDTLVVASRWLSDGASPALIARYLWLAIPRILGNTLPMGMLLAVLVGFGRLSSESETVAVFAGGISFLRTAAPAAVLALLVSVVGYVFNDPLAAYSNDQIAQIKDQVDGVHTTNPFDLPAARSHGVLQATAHIEKGFDLRLGVMKQVTITIYSASGPVETAYAERARYIGGLDWELDDGYAYGAGPPAWYSRFPEISTRELHTDVLQVSAEDMELLSKDPSIFTFAQLSRRLRHLPERIAHTPEARYDEVVLWSKISFPLASLIFTLVGAPIALRPQRTSRLTGWIISVPMILVYWISFLILTSMARADVIPPMLAAFLPDIVGGLLGIYLIAKRSA